MDRNKNNFKILFQHLIFWVLLGIAIYLSYFVYFPDMGSTRSKWVGLFCGALAILFAGCKSCENSYFEKTGENITNFKNLLFRGLGNFASQTLACNTFLMIFILCVFAKFLNPLLTRYILIGNITVFLVCNVINFIGTKFLVDIDANVQYGSGNYFKFMKNLFVMSNFTSIGILMVALPILYHNSKDHEALIAFALGALIYYCVLYITVIISKNSIDFSRGAIESFTPGYNENSKRNPLMLLKTLTTSLLGASVLSIDYFITFLIAILAATCIGNDCLSLQGSFLPIIIASTGVFASIFAVMVFKISKNHNFSRNAVITNITSTIIYLIATNYICHTWFEIDYKDAIFMPILVGAICALFGYFTNKGILDNSSIIKKIATTFNLNFVNVISQILKESFLQSGLPFVVITTLVILGFVSAEGFVDPHFGLYGISLAVLSMISLYCAFSISNFLPSNFYFEKNILKITKEENIETYNRFSKNTADYARSYSLGVTYSNVLTILCSISALICYSIVRRLEEIDVLNPYVICAILLGTFLIFFCLNFTFSAINRTAAKISFEVKKQYRNNPEILTSQKEPNYKKCVNTALTCSLLFGSILILIVFISICLINYYLKEEALGGLFAGILIIACPIMLIFQNSSLLTANVKRYFKNSIINDYENTEFLNTLNGTFRTLANIIPALLSVFIKFIAILLLFFSILFTQ